MKKRAVTLIIIIKATQLGYGCVCESVKRKLEPSLLLIFFLQVGYSIGRYVCVYNYVDVKLSGGGFYG